jgi:tetratricopeptide (TPR) repeat protein
MNTKTLCLLAIFVFPFATGWLSGQDLFLPVSSPSDRAVHYYEEALNALFKAEFDEMKDKMDMAVTHDPQFFMAYFQLAMLDWRFKEKDSFDRNHIKALSCRVKLSPTEQVCRQILMGLEEDLYANVSHQGKNLIEMHPDVLEAHLWHGRLSRWSSDPETAIEAYQKIVALKPDFAPVYNLLAYAQMAAGNMEEAEKAFDAYIEAEPDHPNPYDSKGEFYLAIGKYREAEEYFEKAMAIRPGFLDSGDKAEVARAMQIVEKETTSFFKKDFEGWLSCYQQSPSAFHSYSDKQLVRQYEGWRNIARGAREIMEEMPSTPSRVVLRRNLNYRIMGDNVWLIFDQYMGDNVSKEMRLMEKVNGRWKIVLMSAVGVSSYNDPKLEVTND